jgi:hypothetical protein
MFDLHLLMFALLNYAATAASLGTSKKLSRIIHKFLTGLSKTILLFIILR